MVRSVAKQLFHSYFERGRERKEREEVRVTLILRETGVWESESEKSERVTNSLRCGERTIEGIETGRNEET